jgi:hypothetical protein
MLGLFCGFLIQESRFPRFWLFMYWLNPVHYTLEGLITTQFLGDNTEIKLLDGSTTTAEIYISDYQYKTWKYENVGYDVMALCLFIGLSM